MPQLDHETLASLKDLLGQKFVELIQTYIDDGGRRLALLQGAVVTLDFDVIRAEAHGLKGSSRNIGAVSMGDCCCKMETLGKDQNSDEVEKILATIEQDFAATCNALTEYL